jgi:hypothetical protein
MTDWYFAGMFDETFWAQVGKQRFSGKESAEVLRQVIAEAGEADLTWLPSAKRLDALCRMETAFEIKRRGVRIEWVLNPFRTPSEERGIAETIGDAIDALIRAARMRYGSQWARTGPSERG